MMNQMMFWLISDASSEDTCCLADGEWLFVLRSIAKQENCEVKVAEWNDANEPALSGDWYRLVGDRQEGGVRRDQMMWGSVWTCRQWKRSFWELYRDGQTIVDRERDWSNLYWRMKRCSMQWLPNKIMDYIEHVNEVSVEWPACKWHCQKVESLVRVVGKRVVHCDCNKLWRIL